MSDTERLTVKNSAPTGEFPHVTDTGTQPGLESSQIASFGSACPSGFARGDALLGKAKAPYEPYREGDGVSHMPSPADISRGNVLPAGLVAEVLGDFVVAGNRVVTATSAIEVTCRISSDQSLLENGADRTG